MTAKIFKLEHAAFYKEFDAWIEELESSSNPKTGVYFLKTIETVPRALQDDEEGVLYIGQGILKNRVGLLINSCNNTDKKHDAGVRYFEHLSSKYPIKNCRIEILTTDKPQEDEKLALLEYISVFGELPPLNRQDEN